jgi:hypothetical protein
LRQTSGKNEQRAGSFTLIEDATVILEIEMTLAMAIEHMGSREVKDKRISVWY